MGSADTRAMLDTIGQTVRDIRQHLDTIDA